MDSAKVRADGSWQYAGAEGALVFCADKSKGGLWFRVVDLGVSQAFVIIGYIIMKHQKGVLQGECTELGANDSHIEV